MCVVYVVIVCSVFPGGLQDDKKPELSKGIVDL